MRKKTAAKKRSYDRSSRVQSATESKEAVIELAMRLLQEQGEHFSIRKLAQATTYSERHLYRIFNGIEGLASAINLRLNRLLRLDTIFQELTLENLPDAAVEIFAQFNKNEKLVRAYLESPLGRAAREVWLREKRMHLKAFQFAEKEMKIILSASFWKLVKDEGQMSDEESLNYIRLLGQDLKARIREK